MLASSAFAKVCAVPKNARSFATGKPALKVAVLGAAGGIGQPLSLLLKQNPRGFNQLSLYDIVNTPGVAADLSHIPTAVKVTGHVGEDQLAEALKGVNIAVVPAGVPRKPGMTRDDLFNTNATIVYKLATALAKYAPQAHVLVISNPVNSTVPIVAETLKKHGVYNPKRLFGVTTLDVLRANTFLAELKGLDPAKTEVPVVGGHAGATILPLFSQVAPAVKFQADELEKLTHRVQFGGDEVVKAKAGTGSATLSMAVAAFRFTTALARALHGEKQTECAFVQSSVVDGVPFFASRVELGAEGVAKIHPVGSLSPFEQQKFKEMLPELQKNIEKGVEFVKKQQ
jgi:malate dehydrogenase